MLESTNGAAGEVSPLRFVTTGRTATIVWTAVGLALLAWLLRPVVSGSGRQVYLHHAPLDSRQVLAFVLVPATLIVLLVAVRCLNRVLLHAVAWFAAGALANLGELVATGAVADYIFVADRVWSPGDVYLSVGISLLALGMLRVIYDGATRPTPTCSSPRLTDDAERSEAMFEQFTERARQAVILAHEEARSLKHNYIGTEHMLLGLLREKEGEAARVLESLDITVERVRAHVLRLVGAGEEVIPAQIPFTPRAKRLLELALLEAARLGHNYVGTEHMLLAVVRESEGVAARVLQDFDADSETIRNQVICTLKDANAPADGTTGAPPATSHPAAPVAPTEQATLKSVAPPAGGAVRDPTHL